MDSPPPPEVQHSNFVRFFKFGLVDASLVVLGSVAGFSLESKIAPLIGTKGYGMLIGAGIGNTVADAIAGIPEGSAASIGVACGTLVPLVPIALLIGTKRPMDNFARKTIGTSCLVLCAMAFLWNPIQKRLFAPKPHTL